MDNLTYENTITINNNTMKDTRTKLQKFFGYCPQCKKIFRRVEVVSIIEFIGCAKCIEECDDYWSALWSAI